MKDSERGKFPQVMPRLYLMATLVSAFFLNVEGNLFYLFASLTLLFTFLFLLATRGSGADARHLRDRRGRGGIHQEGSPLPPRARAPGKPNWAAK